MAEKLSPFDIAKNINKHGERLDVSETGYEAFVINRIYSNTPDTVAFANEMNKCCNLPKQMQYDFYRFGLNKNPRRYGKWEKRDDDNLEELKVIMEVYGYSRAKAIEVYPMLKPHMTQLRAHVDKGGKH